MTACNFRSILAFVLTEEGGKVNDPRDPGGFTDHGITLATYREFAHRPGFTQGELEALTGADIAAFYGTRWNQIQGDALASGVDLMVMDQYVNSGTNSGRILQRVLGYAGPDVDGWIGPETIRRIDTTDPVHLALRMPPAGIKLFQAGARLAQDGQAGPVTLSAVRVNPSATLVAALFAAQALYYKSLPGYGHDGRGWDARLTRRAALGMSLAVPTVRVVPAYRAGSGLRAPI